MNRDFSVFQTLLKYIFISISINSRFLIAYKTTWQKSTILFWSEARAGIQIPQKSWHINFDHQTHQKYTFISISIRQPDRNQEFCLKRGKEIKIFYSWNNLSNSAKLYFYFESYRLSFSDRILGVYSHTTTCQASILFTYRERQI